MKRSACDEMRMAQGTKKHEPRPSSFLFLFLGNETTIWYVNGWYYLFIVLMGLEEGLGQVQGGRDDPKSRGWFGSPG